jgi:tryptophanyl-tRNA synthetase
MPDRVLTGIKPTGHPHLGNYVGAIQPALARAERAAEAFFFIADYHALNQIHDPRELNQLSYSVAASWLACGLDPGECLFYRQSDVPEVFELNVVLAAMTPKGWMNTAHAYKAAVAENEREQRDRDAQINMGLYTYPLLMAADILLFDANVVPVGRDQVQHVEIARDIAARFNSHYGDDVLVLPEYELEGTAEAMPGLDGRKMSKSYNNTIPLFATPEAWRKAVYAIKTDSTPPAEPKPTEGAPVYEIFAALADAEEAEALRQDLERGGIGWAEAKARLLALVEARFAARVEVFESLMADPRQLDEILQAGAERARPLARATIERVRRAIGRAGSVDLLASR